MAAASSLLEQMPQSEAWQRLQNGGCIVLAGAPAGTIVSVDLAGWAVSATFMGFKMVPPGPHFISVSYVNEARVFTCLVHVR